MQRTVVVIDPFEKAVDNVTIAEGTPILDQFRDLLGCVQLDTAVVAAQMVLWVDNLGLLKGKSQRFWRFKDSTQRIAGRAILTRTDTDGMPMPLAVNPEDFAAGIDWCEGVFIERIIEELEADLSELGPYPRVVRKVLWGEEERHVFWMVYNDDENDDFVAKERVTDGDFTGEERRFESLDEVRAFAKEKDLVFTLPDAADSPDIAATLV